MLLFCCPSDVVESVSATPNVAELGTLPLWELGCRELGLQPPEKLVLGLIRSMSGSSALAPSLQPLPVSTTGCSKHDKIVDLASLRDRGLRLMDLVVRDAIVTQGSATDSGWWRQRLLNLVRTQNITS